MATRVSELLATLNDQVSAKAAKISDSLGDAAASADNLDGSLKRTGQTQAQFVKNADGVQKATDRINSAFDTLEQKLERATQMYLSGSISLEKYRDMQATLVAQYERVETGQQKTIDSLRQKGAALSQVTNATGGASDAAQKHASAVKLESYQVGMLADEFHKWVDQVLSGGSAMQATIYQAPNMIQAMGGVGDALSLVRAGLTGVGGVAAGIGIVVAGLGALGVAAEHEQSYLAGLSQHLRATRADYDAMAASVEASARQISAHSDMSLSDSRATVETFAAVPTVDAPQFTRLTQDARNLATVMNETVPDAAKTMAEAMRDPLKAAQDLAEQGILGVDQSLVLQIQHLEESGHQMEAWTTLLNQMEHAAANAHTQGLTPFQSAMEQLSGTLAEAKEHLAEFFVPLGTIVVEGATKAVQGLNALWSWELNKLHLITGMGSSVGAATNSADATKETVQSGTTASAVLSAQLHQTLDANLSGTDGSVTGQIGDQQRQIEGLNKSLSALHQLRSTGQIDDATYATDLQSLTGKLNEHNVALAALKTPYQELIEQQGKTAASAAALTGYQRAMVEADQQLDDVMQRTNGGHATHQQLLANEARVAGTLAEQYDVSTAAILRNVTAQNAIAQAWQSGGAAASHATNYWAAYNDALDHFSTSAPGFAEAVTKRTQALDALTEAQNNVRLTQQTSANEDQLSLLTAETRSIGMDSNARAVLIAHMQAEQELRREGKDLTATDSQAYLDSVDAVTRATQAYQHQQDVLSDLTGSLSSMVDTIGDDITQALIQGAGAGVNFQSALQGIESQVVTMIAKLALINPLLNSIDGGTRNTLDDVFGLLSKGTSTSSSGDVSSSGFSIGQLFNMRKNAASGGDPFGGAGTNVNPNFDAGNDGSEQISVTGIRSSGYSTGQWAGSVLGGVAGGMSLGSMLSGIGGGTYGTYGSLAGTALGTGVGAIFGPMGSLIGGSVLGGLGGLIGGLFGHKKNPYTLDNVMVSGGQLGLGTVYNQSETDNVTSQLTSDIASINAVLSANGLTASGGESYQGGNRLGYVGDDANNKDPSLRNLTLAQWLPDLNLTTSDATFQQALDQGMPSSFSSVSDFTTAIASLKTMADTVDSLHVSVSKFNSDATVTVDHIDGYSGDLSTAINALDGQTMDVSTLQQRIAEISSTWQQLASSARSVDARYLAATGNQEGADLENFDVSADQQRADLKSSFETIWGDAYATQSSYVQQSADLEKTLAAERLQIQAEYNGDSIAQQQQYLSQAQQSVESVYSSLSSYAQGLALSSASPLSVQDQYNLAEGNLMSDYQSAQGGDYDALSRIQSDAQSFLGLSQSWQGSGTGYTADYQQTLKVLQSLAGADTGALTATLAQKLAQNQVDASNGTTTAVATLQKALQTDIQQLSRLLVNR